ncbi:glycosyltransferase [Runella sp.]|uniref:glycosyltransferase n=1 Tax=Runella sp. TaxID=1960881 RepID=UPI003D0C5D3F
MKVLHIIEGLDKRLGGLPYSVSNIIRVEKELGYCSFVLSIEEHSYELDTVEFNEENLFLFSSSFPKRFYRSKNAIEWLKKNISNFELLVFHSTWNVLCLESSMVARKAGVPYIVWPHGSLDPFDLQKKQLFKKILGPLIVKPYLEHSKFICCTSDKEAQMLVTYSASCQIHSIPLPVFSISPSSPSSLSVSFREKYQYSDDDFVFLFLSRINYKKGLEDLLNAISLLPDLYKQKVKLAIAGTGEPLYVEKIKELVVKLKLQEVVSFLGQLSGYDKIAAFYGSDTFVLTSQNENFGIVIVEAMQAGLPALVSNNVYICSSIEAHKAGWVCELNEISIVHALTTIIESVPLMIDFQKNAFQLGQSFSVPQLKVKYKNLYESAVKSSN